MTILPQIYVEVTKIVSFNAIFMLLKISKKIVWFGERKIVPATIGLVFGNNNSKNMFSMSLGKDYLKLCLRSFLIKQVFHVYLRHNEGGHNHRFEFLM